MNKDAAKVIFFDELTPVSLRSLKRIRNLRVVFYFEISKKNNERVLQGLSSFKEVDFINLKNIEYPFTLYYSQMKSYDIFDRIYENNIKDKRILRQIRKLFSSEDTDLVYKREILDHIQSQLIKEMMMDHVVSSIKCDIKILYYTLFEYSLYGDKTLLSGRVEKKYNTFRVKLYRFSKKICECLLLFFPFYIFIRSFGGIKKKQEKRRIKLGINLNLPGIFSKNYHYFYYLIDPLYNIKKEDYLLIDEKYDTTAVSELIDVKGGNYYSIYKRAPLTAGCFMDIAGKFVFNWIYCFILSLFQDQVMNRSTRILLSDYMKWNIFFDRYDLEKYVDILMPDHPSKIAIFQKNGVDTYFVYPDNYTDDYHSGYDERILAQTYFCFMKYDTAIVYGEKTKRYFEKSRNNIDSYLKNGVIHSQRINEIRAGKYEERVVPSDLFEIIPRRVIGVFDIAFVNWGFMHLSDAINFGESILRLLDEFPDIGIIFKEKKEISEFPGLSEVYNKIGQHPRGAYIRKTNGSDIYSYDVIAASDMVISACFTSTHAEALGSKTRSIYYDVKGDYIGENYYFNKFPYTVAHNYNELKALVKKWIYEVEDVEFESYLERYVKGEIDEYLDQRAIDRIQNIFYNHV